MASSTVILKAAGLNTSPNQLSVDEGSMQLASNVIVRRDGIIEQRRGFLLYGDSFPSSSQRAKQLSVYRDRLIRHAGQILQFDSNGSGLFETYDASVSETETGLRMKFVESNGNLYFTTSEGIKKLASRNGAGLSNAVIEQAGAVKALDLEAETIYEAYNQTGFLPQDSTVAYRVVWNKKDINTNLITGTPSQRAVVYNPLFNLVVQDYARVLSTLDNLENSPASSVRINDLNYVSTLLLPITASPSQLRTNLIALATKLDNDILYADQAAVAPLQISSASITSGICTVTFTGTVTDYFTTGSKIFLDGFAPATGELDGAQIVVTSTATEITFDTAATGAVVITSGTVVSNTFRAITEPSIPNLPAQNDDLVDLQDYLDAIILALQEMNDFIIATGADETAIAALDITTTTTVSLSFTIPEEVAENDEYFYQVYRSGIAQAVGSAVLDDLSPNDELQLVYEDYPTEAQLSVGEIIVIDVTPEDFRGTNLYTNGSTGEGIAQSNDQPPFAKDVARYRNSVFFANTRTKQRLSLNLLGVQKMIDDYDSGTIPKISVTNGSITNTYQFVTGQQQIRRWLVGADVADSLDGKYLLINTPLIEYYVWFSTGAGAPDPAPAGKTGIRVNINTGETAANVAIKMKNAIALHITEFITEFDSFFPTTGVVVSNIDAGNIEPEGDVDTGFGYLQQQAGRGEQLLYQISQFGSIMTGADFTSVGTADYVTINTVDDQIRYVIWFKAGTATQPVIPGSTYIEVPITGLETDAQVRTLLQASIPTTHFDSVIESNNVIITNRQLGSATGVTQVVTAGLLTASTTQQGAVNILLSPLASPARAVDATARSITRILNKNLGESVYVYYLSGAFDIPGKMLFEARTLQNTDAFYVTANNANTGDSFNPIISPENTITNITTGTTSVVITTSLPHNMESGDESIVIGSNCTPSIDGLHIVTYLTDTTFSIPAFVSIAGTSGSINRKEFALASENEEKSNRVYYSKFQQPEAVPIVNYFDVGSQDKKILRIAPLRDSLFVFKEDGLFRISGDSAPFQLELFDSSYVLLAPDSVAVCNNVLYSWTTQGIQSLTEGGSFVISRQIDNIILKTQSSNFTNFKTATWGVGYESDNSYIVYTVLNREDTYAEIAYRYSTLTQSWTTYDKSNTCGVINNSDDKLYLGAADVSYVEQERKTFDRTDYADREYVTNIGSNAILGNKITLPDVTKFSIGDVITQDQTLSDYEYNRMLEKLDMDTGVGDNDYLATLEMVRGDSPRDKMVALATKMDNDPNITETTYAANMAHFDGVIDSVDAGSITTITDVAHGLKGARVIRITGSTTVPSIDGVHTVTVIDDDNFSIDVETIIGSDAFGTWETIDDNFEDIKGCFNYMCAVLNTDIIVNFNNYGMIDNNTLQEAIITGINRTTRTLTVNLELPFIVGAATVYKAIETSFTYSPTTFGDPLMLKHLSEATIMFETRNITSATISFATDLLPEFIPVDFNLDGNGIFGHSIFGSGFFGGSSNSAPFRTYVPRNCQRCRYIIVKYKHKIAREDYKVLGITVSGNVGQSIKAFR